MSDATAARPRMWGPSIIGFGDSVYTYLLKKLGKYKTGKWCLYIKKLDDVDMVVLKKMIAQAAKGFV